MKRRDIIFVAIIFSLAAAIYLYASNWHPSARKYAVQGIRVSNVQGNINWSKLSDQGVDFAYIKMTEGIDKRDGNFIKNWTGAAKENIDKGAYHIFIPCQTGMKQASNFKEAYHDALDFYSDTEYVHSEPLPILINFDFHDICPSKIAKSDLYQQVDIFLDQLQNIYPSHFIIDISEDFDAEFGISNHYHDPLWLRSNIIQPTYGKRPWSFWQSSNFRRLRGVDGAVEWVVMKGESEKAAFSDLYRPIYGPWRKVRGVASFGFESSLFSVCNEEDEECGYFLGTDACWLDNIIKNTSNRGVTYEDFNRDGSYLIETEARRTIAYGAFGHLGLHSCKTDLRNIKILKDSYSTYLSRKERLQELLLIRNKRLKQ